MVKQYLLGYNGILSLGWLVFLVLFLTGGLTLTTPALVALNIFQGAAVLEILHSVMKWVPSPVFTTTLQVLSRIFVLILINVLPEESMLNLGPINGTILISLAWGITEIIRYAYYFFELLKRPIALLTTLRYSLFIILYPTGVTGEFFILISALLVGGFGFDFPDVALCLIMLSYFVFFPKLYGYMWAQRKKKL